MIYLTILFYGNVLLIIIYRTIHTYLVRLSEIHTDLLLCTDCKCLDYKHKHDIDLLCRSIIMSGLNASGGCIPITRCRTREVPG